MEKKYKQNEVEVVRSEELSRVHNEDRFIIRHRESGEILDNAQGFGYKSRKKAYKAWWWVTKTPQEKRKYEEKKKLIGNWCEEHREVEAEVFDAEFRSLKEHIPFSMSMRDVEYILRVYNLSVEGFTVRELWRYLCG